MRLPQKKKSGKKKSGRNQREIRREISTERNQDTHSTLKKSTEISRNQDTEIREIRTHTQPLTAIDLKA
jgi:hypothetical protein